MTASNAVLITVDSLRADHVGSFGHDRETTPRLDELAADGTVFTEAIANGPNTPTSFPSILTSTHATMYGGYRHLDGNERPFLAETLAAEDRSTVGFHSNPHLGREQNYDAGFDTFEDSAEGSDSVASLKDRVERILNPDSRLYSLLRRLWHYASMSTDTAAYASASTITDNAVEWLEDNDSSFFMWLHYMDVHYPFTPPDSAQAELGIDPLSKRRIAELNGAMQENPDALSNDDVEDLVALYDAEIRYTDSQIGTVLDALAKQDVREETAVVVTADHGEAFGEHGRFGHHPYLYDELLRVPLVIDAPDMPCRRVDEQVSLLDLGPTTCTSLGVDPPAPMQGKALQTVAEGGHEENRIAIAIAADGDHLACRTREWKYFWQVEEDVVELYDLKADPDETVDVSDEHPEICKRFRAHLEDYRGQERATDTDQPDVEQSEAVKHRLEDLGYID